MTQTKDRFRAAMVQMRSTRDVQENLDQALAFIRDAASRGAAYIQTPENTLLMETESAKTLEKSRSETETAAVATFATTARELGVWLHIGSIAIKVSDSRAVNRAFLFSPAGKVAATYDKIHMFDVDLPSGEIYRESATFEPGAKAVLAELPWGGLGITTCYDLRFPEQFNALAVAGAQFLTVPSAFTKVTGEAHWHTLLRARAIENGCFVFAAAQGGRHASGRTTFGHSIVISPWGEILAEADTEPGIIVADIDVGAVSEVRARIPTLTHKRSFTLEVVKLDSVASLEAAE